jgi:hypothetical protein
MADEIEQEKERKRLENQKLKRKIRISKLRIAAIGINLSDPGTRRKQVNDFKRTTQFREGPTSEIEQQLRMRKEVDFINQGGKIRPPKANINKDLRKKLASLTPQEERTINESDNIPINKRVFKQEIKDKRRVNSNLANTLSPMNPVSPHNKTFQQGIFSKKAKVKSKLALITKGNTTFQKKRPEDITDIEDINRNIKPLKGSHPRKDTDPIPSSEKGTRVSAQQKVAKAHHHSIVFRGHPRGQFKIASLFSQDQKFAKYFLLNAKQINGNGWGIAQHTARENMQKFVGRPLVITSSLWHGASLYGESYEHPYLPTNNLKQIFSHQEQFRVGNIVAIDESKNGDFHAVIEMLPKFAGKRLPPFCSPAIFQLDAMEKEGNISKWEALHLAALDSDPAYGARIAILKGTCIGTTQSCTVQFKSAKFVGRPGEGKKAVVKRKLGEIMDGTVIMNESEKKTVKELTGKIICAKNTKRLRARLAAITAFGKPKKPHTPKDQKELDLATSGFTQRDLKKKNN